MGKWYESLDVSQRVIAMGARSPAIAGMPAKLSFGKTLAGKFDGRWIEFFLVHFVPLKSDGLSRNSRLSFH